MPRSIAAERRPGALPVRRTTWPISAVPARTSPPQRYPSARGVIHTYVCGLLLAGVRKVVQKQIGMDVSLPTASCRKAAAAGPEATLSGASIAAPGSAPVPNSPAWCARAVKKMRVVARRELSRAPAQRSPATSHSDAGPIRLELWRVRGSPPPPQP